MYYYISTGEKHMPYGRISREQFSPYRPVLLEGNNCVRCSLFKNKNTYVMHHKLKMFSSPYINYFLDYLTLTAMFQSTQVCWCMYNIWVFLWGNIDSNKPFEVMFQLSHTIMIKLRLEKASRLQSSNWQNWVRASWKVHDAPLWMVHVNMAAKVNSARYNKVNCFTTRHLCYI